LAKGSNAKMASPVAIISMLNISDTYRRLLGVIGQY
jgi:hypothetical protein